MPRTPAHRELIDAIARLQRVQREVATDLARDLDCPRAALSLLWVLDKRGEMAISDVAQHLHVDMSVASRQTSALVDAGYAERSTPGTPGTDRRVRTVRLTELGRTFTAGTKQALDDRAAAVFSGWSVEDLMSAAAQIERVADTVAALGATAHPVPAPAPAPAPDEPAPAADLAATAV
ncbi:MarR family transcriptional regulator [Cellulomonas hominis]|uniref:MarR family winged helix-turn-helix transcriptional regulator n=1 Tax=Cellulomonas hominis TaxID=156981 RepID=UPI001C1227F7|nr:MarR family transcriptional regulator [Cellulomonas hominis]MBU5421542.1 MarR family transcriptional regulator [Cellulomonas hominis]